MVVGLFEDGWSPAVEDCEANRLAEILSPLAVELEIGEQLELAYLLERIAALIAPPRFAPNQGDVGFAVTPGTS